jgi:osmotically-inducible protein OsmY
VIAAVGHVAVKVTTVRRTEMTHDALRLDVAAEVSCDPRVNSEAIAVSADTGAVTLTGTVGSLREKLEAGRAAARVYGVTEVRNQLRVRTPAGPR